MSEIIPWFEDAPLNSQPSEAELLVDIWQLDRDLGSVVAALPWVVDGVDSLELESLINVEAYALLNVDFAALIASLPVAAGGADGA